MYVYEEGETPFIETLFSSDTFSQILDRTEYLNTTQLKVEKTMGEIETIKQKLQDKRVEQKEKRREQKRLKNDLNLQYKELANDKAEKSSLLNETKAKQSDFQQKVDRLSAEAKKVESEMERLERLSRSGNSGRLNNCPAGPNYRFSFPSSGGITCDYYCYSGHTGTDFGAGYDGYARASAPGKVVESNFYYPNLSNPDWGYGNYVRIEHSGGWYTLYAHLLKNRYVSEGQYVSRGQVIGEIGYVGNVIPLGLAGTHLHFEIRKSYWQPVNPECYLY
jgi:murein DD-endopeptidase MepM/ murein hydrolase activator NlpD